MTLTEILNFKGGSLEEYERLLNEKRRLERAIRRNSIRMYDEESSIEVIGTPQNEKEEASLEKHIKGFRKAEKALKENQEKLLVVQRKIENGEY